MLLTHFYLNLNRFLSNVVRKYSALLLAGLAVELSHFLRKIADKYSGFGGESDVPSMPRQHSSLYGMLV